MHPFHSCHFQCCWHFGILELKQLPMAMRILSGNYLPFDDLVHVYIHLLIPLIHTIVFHVPSFDAWVPYQQPNLVSKNFSLCGRYIH